MTHTPEPWEWDAGIVPPDGPQRYSDIYVLEEGEPLIIAEFNDNIPAGRANARRIVACVNALSGISTEAIEAGAVQGVIDAAKAVYDNHRGPKKQVTFHSGALLEQLASALSQLAEASNG